MGISTGKVYTIGWTDLAMRGIGSKVKFKVEASTSKKTAGLMTENGNKI
jgi:hypothetical protein